MKTREWLAEHRKTIGASEAAGICNLSPWPPNAFEIWEVKTGKCQPRDLSGNADVIRGEEEEPTAIRYFERYTGWFVEPHLQTAFMYSEKYPFAHALPDAWAAVDGESQPVDAKCPRPAGMAKVRKSQTVPEHYQLQGQHTLAITGASTWHIWFFDVVERSGVHLTVQRDDAVIDYLMEIERQFWECVQRDIPPSGEPVVRPDDDQPKILSVPEAMDAATRLKMASEASDRAEEEFEAAKADLIELSGGVTKFTVPGIVRVSHSESAGRKTFDSAKAIARFPELAGPEFEKIGKPYRTFRPTFLKP